MSGTYPGKDGEEAEEDGGSGGVGSFVQWVVFLFRNLPLIGQKTETNEPDQRPERCRELSYTRLQNAAIGKGYSTRRRGLTWHPDVGHDGLLPVLHTADLREVHIQCQEGGTAEETQRPHGDGIVTGDLVAVEDAELFDFVGTVNVTLVSDTAKDHYGQELETERRQQLAQC